MMVNLLYLTTKHVFENFGGVNFPVSSPDCGLALLYFICIIDTFSSQFMLYQF